MYFAIPIDFFSKKMYHEINGADNLLHDATLNKVPVAARKDYV